MATIAASTRMTLGATSRLDGARHLLDLGFEALALDEGLSTKGWEELESFLSRDVVVASALFAPRRLVRGKRLPPPRLGSLDSDERREVVKLARQSIEFLDRHEIATLIIPPVRLEDPAAEDFQSLLQKPVDLETWVRLRSRRDQSESARRQFDAYLSTLDAILDHADRYGRRVAITHAGLPFELPDIAEVARVFDTFGGAPLTLCADVLRLDREERSGGERVESVTERFGASVSLVRVHDGDKACEGRPLGKGSADLDSRTSLAEAASGATWFIDLDATASEDEILLTREQVERLLARPAEDENSDSAKGGIIDTSFRDPL